MMAKAALEARAAGSRPGMPHVAGPRQPHDAHDAGDGRGAVDLVQAQVYIGLNDSVTRQQVFETDRYVETLKEVCLSHRLPFSLDVVSGGYVHDDGTYTEENTIVLTFIDADPDAVDEIARDLCSRFHQESVLITCDLVRVRTVSVEPADGGRSS
jgi:methyl coenzyme M reductase subunit D